MRLYDFEYSPNPLKVRLCLAELGLGHDTVKVDLFRGEQRGESFLKVNSLGKVPALQDGGLTLRESNAIVAYLGRRYGGALWPEGLAREAEALQWLFFESRHLNKPCGDLWWADIVAPVVGRSGASAEILEESREDLEWALGHLEQHFARQPFILGADFSLVDCSLGVTLNSLRGTRADKRTSWPNVTEYRERIRGRKSWSEANGDAIHNLRAMSR